MKDHGNIKPIAIMTQQEKTEQQPQVEVVNSDYEQESTAMQERTDYTKEEIQEAGIKVASKIFSFF